MIRLIEDVHDPPDGPGGATSWRSCSAIPGCTRSGSTGSRTHLWRARARAAAVLSRTSALPHRRRDPSGRAARAARVHRSRHGRRDRRDRGGGDDCLHLPGRDARRHEPVARQTPSHARVARRRGLGREGARRHHRSARTSRVGRVGRDRSRARRTRRSSGSGARARGEPAGGAAPGHELDHGACLDPTARAITALHEQVRNARAGDRRAAPAALSSSCCRAAPAASIEEAFRSIRESEVDARDGGRS